MPDRTGKCCCKQQDTVYQLGECWEHYFPYRVEKRRPKMFWSYKERNYANIQPEVRRGGEYSFHMAYAKAFRII